MYAEGGGAMADDHIAHLSMFLRTVLETSRHRAVPLSRELMLVDHYLRVCANRNPGHFKWELSVDRELSTDRIAIPPMIIQPIVENALEHGIASMDKGLLRIEVARSDNDLLVTVTDNGIGRNAAADVASRRGGTSMGLDLVRQRLALFDRKRSSRERVSIENASNENGRSPGTRVTLRMRLKYLDEHVAAGDR
jgi:LytS/YehU family sensor histidine kinase